MSTRRDRDLPSHPGRDFPGAAGIPRVPERAVTDESILQVEEGGEVSFVNAVSVNAQRKLIEVFRNGTDEPTDNLFKRGFDHLGDVLDGGGFRKTDYQYVDTENRPTAVYRDGVVESVLNLFKRGVDTLGDVVDGGGYRKLLWEYVDVSNRAISLFRSGTNEPSENLFKRNVDTLDDVEDGATYKRMSQEEYTQAVLRAPQGANLLLNPGFEDGEIGWQVEGVDAVVFHGTSASRTGGRCLIVEDNNTDVYAGGTGGRFAVPVVPGQVVSAGAWVYKVAGSVSAQVTIQFVDASFAHVDWGYAQEIPSDSGYGLISTTNEVPSGAAWAYFKVRVNSGSDPTVSYRFDDIYLMIHQSVEQITDAASEAFTFEQSRSWVSTYTDAGAGTPLKYHDGTSPLPSDGTLGRVFLVWAERSDWATPNGDIFAFHTDETGTWSIENLYEEGVSTGHPFMYIDPASGNPWIGTHGSTGNDGDFEVYIEEYKIPQTPTLWAALGLAEDGWLTSGLQDGVGQTNGSETLPLTKGYTSGEASDGDAVVFTRNFEGAPMVILEGGLTYEPRSAQWDNGFNSALPTYKDLVADSVSAAGFTVRAVLRQTSAPTQISHTSGWSDSNLTNVGQTAQKNLDNAPATDGQYTFQYDVYMDAFLESGQSIVLTLAIDTNDGSGWVERATKTYLYSDFDGPTYTRNNETMDATVSGLDNTDDIRLKVKSWSYPGSSGATLSVTPDEVRYVSDAGGSEATATPETTDKVRWKAMETS